MKADLLAKAVAYNKPNDWRFLDLLKSANLYGLVSGSGQHATVSLEKIGQDIIARRCRIERMLCSRRFATSKILERSTTFIDQSEYPKTSIS